MWRSYSFRKEVVSGHPAPNIAHEDAYGQFLHGWSDLVCQPRQLTLQPVLSSSADHGRPTRSLIAGSKLRSVSKMAGIIATTMTLSLVLICMCLPAVYTSPIKITRTGEVEAGKFGAVASESELCSRYGSDMLKKGGSAADSLVATAICVGTVASYHSGIGGGGHMLVRAPNNTYEYIDYRETAPAAAFEDMFEGNEDGAVNGGLASAVPGDLRGLEYLHKHYGKLPWSMVIKPSVQLARQGFPVTEDMVHYMDSAVEDSGGLGDFLCNEPSWALDFCPNGTRLSLGKTITRKRFADTLEAIANDGPDVFYRGPIAEATIKAVQATNGTMTLDDLRNYSIAIRKTAEIDYRGLKVTGTTSPSSGAIALSILKILDTYEPFCTADNVNISTHRLDEAVRFGYGQRTLLGDPSFVQGIDEYQEDILKKSIIDHIRSRISDDRTQNVSAYDPQGIESLKTAGTSHIIAADHSGLVISAITTVNTLFGSKVMVPETGVVMNNEMDDFSIPRTSNSFGYIPSKANYIRPGKRPLSSMSPTIVTHPNGTLYLVAGSAGGSRIITATVQNVIHAVDQGMSAAEALAQPRLHDQLIPNQAVFEYAYDNATVAFMKARGHNVTWIGPGKSTAQALRMSSDGTFDAAGEPRLVNSGGVVL